MIDAVVFSAKGYNGRVANPARFLRIRQIGALTFYLAGIVIFSAGMRANPARQTAANSARGPANPRTSFRSRRAYYSRLATNPSPEAHAYEVSNELTGISCISASDCWAVGDFTDQITSTIRALVEHWDGSAWSIFQATGQLEPVFANSCDSGSDCWAAGDQVAHWDGTQWSAAPSPEAGLINSITCTSATDCWAVGVIGSFSNGQTSIEHWDGATWMITSSPNVPNASFNELEDVACLTSSDCWAVGHYNTSPSSSPRTLVEHWNGTLWSIVSSPNPDPGYNLLYAVTCTSSSFCWAAGLFDNSNGGAALFEKWDGISWTAVPPPSNPNFTTTVYDVACTSTSDCWAVGSYGNDESILIERWNGNAWSIVVNPGTSEFTFLSGVACNSASDCTAVGQRNLRARIEHWDGSAWTDLTPLPSLAQAVSRKVHSSAGSFDIDLSLNGSSGIEPRNGGANGDHTIVFTFAQNLTSIPFFSTSVGAPVNGFVGPAANQWTANISGVPNASRATTTLSTDSDHPAETAFASATMGVLIGDTNGDGSVNSADVSQTKARSGQPISSTNFRSDVTVDGALNSSDVSLVKSKSGIALP